MAVLCWSRGGDTAATVAVAAGGLSSSGHGEAAAQGAAGEPSQPPNPRHAASSAVRQPQRRWHSSSGSGQSQAQLRQPRHMLA